MASVRKRKGVKGEPWVCEYTDPATGKRRRITPETGLKKDADAIKRRIEAEIERGEHTAATETKTVREVCEEFIRHSEDRLRDGRIGRSRYTILNNAVNKFIAHIGSVKFADIKASHVLDLYKKMIEADRLQPTTSKDWVYIFKMVEDYALVRGYTKKQVVVAAARTLKGVQAKPVRTFTIHEAHRLFQAALTKKWRGSDRSAGMLVCYLHLAAFCGLRFGEIQGLTVANIDFASNSLRIRHNLTRFGEHKGPKTRAGIRNVPMPATVADLLQRWLGAYHLPNDKGLVFSTRAGTMLTNNSFRQTYWLPLLKTAGLYDDDPERLFHFHALRHFSTSLMQSSGFGVNEVPRLLGHKNLDTTLQIYSHSILDEASQQVIADKMVGAFLALPAPDAPQSRQGPANI